MAHVAMRSGEMWRGASNRAPGPAAASAAASATLPVPRAASGWRPSAWPSVQRAAHLASIRDQRQVQRLGEPVEPAEPCRAGVASARDLRLAALRAGKRILQRCQRAPPRETRSRRRSQRRRSIARPDSARASRVACRAGRRRTVRCAAGRRPSVRASATSSASDSSVTALATSRVPAGSVAHSASSNASDSPPPTKTASGAA